jgi:lysophospholipid acyltransferase (LPLAT)-like uncharacterized protein
VVDRAADQEHEKSEHFGEVTQVTGEILSLIATLVSWVLRLWRWTWRVQATGDPLLDASGLVLTCLHQDLAAAGLLNAHVRIRPLVSQSWDGERLNALLVRIGYGASVRGSSSRGGPQARQELLAYLASGGATGIAVDGPRGPAKVPKPGAAHLARHGPLVYVRVRASPVLCLKSWDRAQIPLPFASIQLRYELIEGETAEERQTGLARAIDAPW